MRQREEEVLQAIRAAHRFIRRYEEEFMTVAQAGAYRRLGETLKRVEDYAAQQSVGALAGQGATRSHRALRQALLDEHMLPISRVARLLALDTPQLAPLKMPRGYLAPELLIARAHAMAEAASRFKDDFVEAGLDKDFVRQMNVAVDHFREANDERMAHRGISAGATQGLRAELSSARKLLKVLDSFVTNIARHDPALLAEWKTVKKLPASKAALRVESGEAVSLPGSLPAPITATALLTAGDAAQPVETVASRALLPRSS